MKRLFSFFVGLVLVCCLLICFTFIVSKKSTWKIFVRSVDLKSKVMKKSYGEKPEEKVEDNEIKEALVSSTTEGFPKCGRIHELSCKEPYYSRLVHILQQCKHKEKKEYNLLSSHYKFSNKLKLIMCETPKAASNTLLRRLFLMDPSYALSHPDDAKCGINGNNCFLRISNEEARAKVTHFTSSLITRHPLDRLVSVYLEKFKSNNTYFRQQFGIPAAVLQADHYLHGIGHSDEMKKMKVDEVKLLPHFNKLPSSQQREVLDHVEIMKTGALSFPQFVRFLIDQYVDGKVDEMNPHWRPQVMICQPCAFNYSYVMRFDDVAVDSDRLFDFIFGQQDLKVSEKSVRIPKRSSTVGHNDIAQEYFDQIPDTQMQILRQIYEDDFVFYNYDPYLYHGYHT